MHTINIQQKVFSLLDLTSLTDADNSETIDTLCKKAITPIEHVAAVCVYPQFVKQAASYFLHTPIKVATVANFPHGTDSISQVIQSIQHSIKEGASEIDVVFPYQKYLSGELNYACEFIQTCRQLCGKNILLKVILETGALKEASVIQDVSRRVLNAGADFLKTSTGKIAVGATLEVAEVMLLVIKEMSVTLNRSLGFKASGGIRTLQQAIQYIDLASRIMGEGWIVPSHFRIGTSQVLS